MSERLLAFGVWLYLYVLVVVAVGTFIAWLALAMPSILVFFRGEVCFRAALLVTVPCVMILWKESEDVRT